MKLGIVKFFMKLPHQYSIWNRTYKSSNRNSLQHNNILSSLNFIAIRNMSALSQKEHVVIVGSGWGAYRALRKIDQSKYNITVISPKDYFVFTPLLTGVSVGSIEDRAAIESIRKQQSGGLSHILATVTDIDFTNKALKASSSIPAISNSSVKHTLPQSSPSPIIELNYDKLIIACGAVVNTFNTPGVAEHAYFLKDIIDAQEIRSRIISLFDEAALPRTSDAKRRALLHFVVVGGGPTGVEFLGELYDLIYTDLDRVFPKHIINCVSMSLFDVAPNILATFDTHLSEYTVNRLKSRSAVSIRISTSILKITKDEIFIKSPKEEMVPYGFMLWATGVSPAQLTRNLVSSKREVMPAVDGRSGRILTDKYLRVLKEDVSPISLSNVWSIGDCAGPDLPPTAQVAKQKGEYVGRLINKLHMKMEIDAKIAPFNFKDHGYMAYIGEGKAVVGLSSFGKNIRPITGRLARFFWNSAYFSMLTSWRNRFLVPLYWTLSSWLGREISCVKRQALDNK